eukprot:899740-Rhodomonas_salina.3
MPPWRSTRMLVQPRGSWSSDSDASTRRHQTVHRVSSDADQQTAPGVEGTPITLTLQVSQLFLKTEAKRITTPAHNLAMLSPCHLRS